MAPPVIAIDGPAAAGKGTIARRLAKKLGFHYLDSGKIYRAVAARALARQLSPDDEDAMTALASQITADEAAEAARHPQTDNPQTGAVASRLAKIPAVRELLLPLQRAMLRPPGLVADGRDMGTVVFPDAVLKVFLTAELAVRAARRRLQLENRGIRVKISDILADLQQRDNRDRTRSDSPLVASEDALTVDSSRRAPDAVVCELAERFAAKIHDKTNDKTTIMHKETA